MDTLKQTQSSNRARRAGRFVLHGLNHLLWPAVCLNCREAISETDEGLCGDCWDRLLTCTAGDYCRRCGRDVSRFGIVDGACPDCHGREFSFDQIARAGVYSGTLQRMILAFKNGRTEMSQILGRLAESALLGSGFDDEIELLVPVPLHWSRRLLRGYNQSYVLCKKLKHAKAKIDTNLARIRRTRSQVEMPSPRARARNVAGAFAVRYRHGFASRTVCLVDDVKTTGATLNECARVLKEAGATKVFALVLAVAGQIAD